MKAISATEFRDKQKYYLDLAKKERLIIQRGRNEAFAIIPLADIDETEYLLSGSANAKRHLSFQYQPHSYKPFYQL